MYKKLILPVAAFAVLTSAAATATPAAHEWEIGPVIRGKNYSQGMPLRPQPLRGGWYFDFPVGSAAAGHVHYVTFRPGSLQGKSRLAIRYRVDSAPGTRFVPQEQPKLPGTVSVYFQRRGDNWSAKRGYQYYRWYAPNATVQNIAPGEQEIRIRLDDPGWIPVTGPRSAAPPGAFEEAVRDIDRIGLVFGSSAARGHGVYATAPARFTLLGFRIL